MPKGVYARAMAAKRTEARQKAKDRKNRGDKLKREGAACGAKRRKGGNCGLPAGFGTTHVGFGACKYHGGNVPNHIKKAVKEKAVLMGAPIDINPLDALIWCIKLTAGEVAFCTQQLEILDQEEWLEHTMIGKQVHVWAKERQKAIDRLAKFSKDALALGIADRAVRLAEQYGSSLARYTKGLLDDLELTDEQIKRAQRVA
jgi:hypothetical protein